MELEQFKEKWQQKAQTDSMQRSHSPQELNAMLIDVKATLTKADQQNKFWLIVILVGIGICLGGYLNFRLQYTPERFPRVNIQLYDAGFLAGMVFIILKLLLSTWWTVLFDAFKSEQMDATLKKSLQNISKNFEFIYRLSLYGSCVLLPPLFFLEIRVLSPVFGWQIHQYWWLNVLYSLFLAMGCVGIGHYLYRKSFNEDTQQVKEYLAQLEETNL